MIASIRGTLEAIGSDRVIVSVGGVGLRVLTPRTVPEDIGGVGDTVHLLTYLQVREDSLTLYGFSTQDQLRLFELLISVSGVGASHALGVLSIGSTDAVESAIATGNAGFLAQVPRLGKRLAARIVLELKGKVSPAEGPGVLTEQAIPDADEVVGALMTLGYTAGEAHAAMRSLPADEAADTEERIRKALSYFNRP